MPSSDPTYIGRVRHVLGATVTVELDPGLAGVTPIWRGRLVPVGQVGTLVRIPQGPVYLLGSVVLVGISELSPPPVPTQVPHQGDRWLQVQLLGEVDALGSFQRGVSTYPGLDDAVHFTTADELGAVYPPAGVDRVRIGGLSAAPEIPVALDAARLVARHAAVVGSTGSGKTSAVASLLQSFIAGGWDSANIVVVDPHGEYGAAFEATAATRSVLAADESLLRVPYWALSAQDLLWALCRLDGRTVVDRFSELVVEARRTFAEAADWLELDAESINADTPIPYDLRQVWHQLDYANRVTVTKKVGGTDCVEDPGDAESLTPATFTPYGPAAGEPVQGEKYRYYTPAPERLRLRLSDPRFRFFLQPPDPAEPDPLVGMVREWLGNKQPVSVLDFSGVPADVADVAIGVVLQLVFEIAVRSTDAGIGRPRPVLVVLEEAHRYLGGDASAQLARESTNRIAREGRKYGVGLMLVTQRPSELPDTALAQCGTIIALRLTNGSDQATVRAALPDAVSGLADILPSLRTGEALISGEAIVLPTRTVLRRPDPEPQAGDPSLAGWRTTPPEENSVEEVIAQWRGTAPAEPEP